jgi:hypothetical protein
MPPDYRFAILNPMKPLVYLETSVVSYLAGRRSRCRYDNIKRRSTLLPPLVDFLLTWNCKHLANAFFRRKIAALIADAGYLCPVICTPEELLEN